MPDTFVSDSFSQFATIDNLGETVTGTISVTQSGSTELDLQNTCTRLAAAGTCVVEVTFAPMHPGMQMASSRLRPIRVASWP